MSSDSSAPCCAHRHIEYRTEDMVVTDADAARYAASHDPASPHVPPRAGSYLTRQWWACRDCERPFVPAALASCATGTEDARDVAWVVWSNDHRLWWGANRGGYTSDLLGAGIYTEAEAKEIAASTNHRCGFPENGKPAERAVSLNDALREYAAPFAQRSGTFAIELLRESLGGPASAARETANDEKHEDKTKNGQQLAPPTR